MNICAASVPSDVSEIDLAKLNTTPSLDIAPPRITDAPVSMECKIMQSMPLKGGGLIIVGEVIHFHLRDDIVTSIEPLRIDINKLAPISR